MRRPPSRERRGDADGASLRTCRNPTPFALRCAEPKRKGRESRHLYLSLSLPCGDFSLAYPAVLAHVAATNVRVDGGW